MCARAAKRLRRAAPHPPPHASLQVARPFRARQRTGRREHVLHALPALGRHGCSPAVSSRSSQARAIAHSRFTVAGETPMMSAVSLMLRPPKKRSSTSRPCCASRASSRLSASSNRGEIDLRSPALSSAFRRRRRTRCRSGRRPPSTASRSTCACTVAALRGRAPACVVDENAPHHLRSEAVELRAALPVDLLLIDDAQERFVNERRALQSVRAALVTQMAPRQRSQFFVDQRQQGGQRRLHRPRASAAAAGLLRHPACRSCRPRCRRAES